MLQNEFNQRLKTAISVAIGRIRQAALRNAAGVPIGPTGNLKTQVDVSEMPYGIKIEWEAQSPKGFHYAKVVDEGGPFGITQARGTPANFKEPFREIAKNILFEELTKYLSGDWV